MHDILAISVLSLCLRGGYERRSQRICYRAALS